MYIEEKNQILKMVILSQFSIDLRKYLNLSNYESTDFLQVDYHDYQSCYSGMEV